ncbi:MAG TPA: hypothetical protein PK113_03725, partial [Bacillota bacterium]|nr:hypothetical protein [Bacillota bacterium]
MKKYKYVLYGLLGAIFLGTLFFNDYNLYIQYIRHISLLLLIALLIYHFTDFIANSIQKKYKLDEKKEMIVQIFRVLIFGIIIVVTALVQFKYINYSIGLDQDYFRYYDQYDNLIYSSKYKGESPKIKIIEQSDDRLEMEFKESIEVSYDTVTVEGVDYSDATISFDIVTTITIDYVDNALSYSYSESEFVQVLKSDNDYVGIFTKTDEIVDYRNSESQGYIFSKASKTEMVTGTRAEVYSFDMDSILLDDEDFTSSRYYYQISYSNDTVTFWNLYVEEDIEGVLTETKVLEFAESKDTHEYTINANLPPEGTVAGLITSSVVISEEDDSLNYMSYNEYEGKYYQNDYRYEMKDGIMMCTSRHTKYREFNDNGYDIWSTVDAFTRLGNTIYYNDVVIEGNVLYTG